MSNQIATLQPSNVWNYFYQLTQVPRPSKHEEKIQQFMVDFGNSLGLETFKDEVGNVIIRKPATKGYENAKGVVLQSHLDMVPQANNDTPHNFETDPIQAYIDGEWVTAKGTTLGADNGMGVASIMAILSDKDVEHGPLEALFTCDEETSMMGAECLKPDVLNGKILLNLDSEDEKELYIGCAGGIDGTYKLPLLAEAQNDSALSAFRIELKGLRGGHSGVDIHLQRGNASKLLARLLTQIDSVLEFKLADFAGGNISNAIPREASSILYMNPSLLAELEEQLQKFKEVFVGEFGGVENELELLVSKVDCDIANVSVLTEESKKKLLAAISACPNGVYRMSVDVEGLVETSSNLAIVKLVKDSDECVFAYVECMLRSSVDTARDDLAQQIANVFVLAGGSAEYTGAYPGWKPNPNSEILQIMTRVGEELFGETPQQRAIHAGLECGLLGGTYPHWDMISFGPTIKFPHSPDEKVNIASVGVFYEWLLATLKAIPH